MNIDARNIDLAEWRKLTLVAGPPSPLFVSVSGAHIYGFPSPDSDIDLRGCHCLELKHVVGLGKPKETFEREMIHNGIEVDWVSHDVGKYLGLLVKNNGYILEQVFSPMVVFGQEFLDELRPLAKKCITRNHFFHYRGFFATQKKLIEKQTPVTAKALLYAYRVLFTGIHLMNTGEIETDIRVLNQSHRLSIIDELIAIKVSEKIAIDHELAPHLATLGTLENELENAFEESSLPDNPERNAVNDLLVRIRLETVS